MPTLTINGTTATAPPDSTILDAARSLGIDIPVLCHRDGCTPSTSCMVCVVQDMASGKMIPSCTAPAVEGMTIETDNAAVRDARRVALELLLSDHVGDCDAPCRRVCPAHLDIPLMLRQIATGKYRDALITTKATIPFPATLGRICPAPCEKGCRRAQHDDAVSICLLKRFVGDTELAAKTPWMPPCSPASGKRVAIVGAGFTGLTTTFYLLQHGHACTVFDTNDEPGGSVRREIPAERLPRSVLDAEIAMVRALGAEFRMRMRIGRDISLDALRKEFHAIVLATGKLDDHTAKALPVNQQDGGIAINAHTGETSLAGVFAGGSAVREHHMTIRAVGTGHMLAESVNQFLADAAVTGPHHRFDSMMGKLREGEMEQFMQSAAAGPGMHPPSDGASGFTDDEARQQALRCLHCDCCKRDACLLRDHADDYDARQRRYLGDDRQQFVQIRQHAKVVFEPAKCIKCGLCVQITKRAKEKLGLTFIGRGFDVRVGVPLDESMADALTTTAEACVEACPTGALCGACV